MEQDTEGCIQKLISYSDGIAEGFNERQGAQTWREMRLSRTVP